MDKWSTERINERFVYRKVRWEDLSEGDEIGNIVDGSVELSALSDLKSGGSFTFFGGDEPNPNDLVRIYYSFTDRYGNDVTSILGTFFVTYSDVVYESFGGKLVPSGSVTMSSVLSVMLNSKPGFPFAIGAGENYLRVAHDIAENKLHMHVTVTDDSDKVSRDGVLFEAEDTWRNIINSSLDRISYSACLVDKMGGIIMTPYEKVKNRPIVYEFKDGENAIFMPDMSENNDWQTAGNVVHIYYETEDESLWAEAKNVRGSRMSIESRNGIEREVESQADDSEIEFTTDDHLQELIDRAVERLKDNSTEVDYVTFRHAYVDLIPNDKVRLVYEDHEWVGTIMSMKIPLSPSSEVTTRIRKFKTNSIEVETDGWKIDIEHEEEQVD